jgi:hypothetical protein
MDLRQLPMNRAAGKINNRHLSQPCSCCTGATEIFKSSELTKIQIARLI